jgi:hypothetical protein
MQHNNCPYLSTWASCDTAQSLLPNKDPHHISSSSTLSFSFSVLWAHNTSTLRFRLFSFGSHFSQKNVFQSTVKLCCRMPVTPVHSKLCCRMPVAPVHSELCCRMPVAPVHSELCCRLPVAPVHYDLCCRMPVPPVHSALCGRMPVPAADTELSCRIPGFCDVSVVLSCSLPISVHSELCCRMPVPPVHSELCCQMPVPQIGRASWRERV